MPTHRMIRSPVPNRRWNCLFLFTRGDQLDSDQRQILMRMRALPGRLLVVVAANHVPVMIEQIADAVILKSRGGFDFSAYALALDAIAHHSPGAFVYLQNDSVFGPFESIEPSLERMTWDLSGFIGSAAVENHISSFAFALRAVTPERVAALAPALSSRFAYDRHQHVVALQETRLARIAARTMGVGALWFMPDRPISPPPHIRLAMALGRSGGRSVDLTADIALAMPVMLLDQGFPFMKRSLFGKFSGVADTDALRARLVSEGWDVSPGHGA